MRCVADDVAWLGYSRVILNSENEPAIVAVFRGMLKAARVDGVVDQALGEHPPPYDSQANGLVESAVKSVRGMPRTLRFALESSLGCKILAVHAILTWLVGHAANILTWRVRGVDGLTVYQRVRGKPFSYKLIGFAKRCRFKLASKAPQDSSDCLSQGVYIGRDRMTGQHISVDYEKMEVCKA